MKKIITLVCLLVVSVPGFAATATFNWINPTQNTDGSAIPATGEGALKSTLFEFGTCAATSTPTAPVFGTKSGEVSVLAPTATVTIDVTPGTTVCGRAKSENSFAQFSAFSNVAQRVIPVPVPKPPAMSTTVTVAWEAKFRGGEVDMVVIGSIPVGSMCNPNSSVTVGNTTFYEVELKDVSSQKRGLKAAYSICS